MNASYRAMREERQKLGIPPLPLTEGETLQAAKWLAEGRPTPPDGDENLVELLADRVPAGVDAAARVKALFLGEVASGKTKIAGLSPEQAVALLGAMQGGYNLPPLLACLDDPETADAAVAALSGCLLAGDAVETVDALRKQGNRHAAKLMESWADADWFVGSPRLPGEMKLIVYKVDGEVNTDDLSPARQAPTRPDIPLHALGMGETRFPGGRERLEQLRREAGATGYFPVFVADTLGTGSSRKSATNSLVWVLGRDIPRIPNKRRGGVVIASRIAPIFYNSFEDAGGLPVRADSAKLSDGMRIALKLDPGSGKGTILDDSGKTLDTFAFPAALADEWRAGGRINLIIGRKLSARATALLGRESPGVFAPVPAPERVAGQGYTLAQKLVGMACGKDGVLPGEYCEPAMSTVGSQDTTGPMTRDELANLACLRFSAPMVLQSFCHTAAYPTERDAKMQETLPDFFRERGGVALKPGDGIIHSWLNRMLVPDKVGTGGDSHTRFPLGISFAAGSGLVALAAAMGFMPLEMPESVLVSFAGALRPGIVLRDVVNAIPLLAMADGQLDRPGHGNRNVFNGRILEMEGLDGLTVEEAFELACASAERSAAASTIALDEEHVAEYLRSNAALIEALLADGYRDAGALAKRRGEMLEWLANPKLARRDAAAEFAARLSIDLSKIKEPVIAAPNNPDLVSWLSDKAGEPVDEVFIGSCMSNLGHFRAAAAILGDAGLRLGVKRLWIAPPTRMDRDRMEKEGVLETFARAGARLELPGCSLCMGNQARVADGAVVFSTSTRNFDNRMGAGARVYLGSALLAAVVAVKGRLPGPDEYFEIHRRAIEPRRAELGRPLYFHRAR